MQSPLFAASHTADAMDQSVARRIHALLPARRRAVRTALGCCRVGGSAPSAPPALQRAVTAATLAIVLLGTNLYHYATFDSSYSHPYSFFLFAAFLDLTERWYQQPRQLTSFLLGLVAGLIVLTRHTNVLFLVFLPLYANRQRCRVSQPCNVSHPPYAARRDHRRYRHVRDRATARRLLPRDRTRPGQFLRRSRFPLRIASSPRGALQRSKRRVLLVAAAADWQCAGLAGLARSGDSARAFVLPAALFLAVNTYVIASWWDWQFGGSFGHRGFVDALPIFAIGLAAFLSRCSARPNTARRHGGGRPRHCAQFVSDDAGLESGAAV